MDKDSIAAVYLARNADGHAAFRRFAESYKQHAAGIGHDLVIIFKGFDQVSDLQSARQIFEGLPHIGVELPDTGYDIGSYLECSQRISHTHFCFLNTQSEIAASSWLANLYAHVRQDQVGIAGATGSYESLNTSWKLIQKYYWLYYLEGFRHDDTVARHYAKFRDYLPGEPSMPAGARRGSIMAYAKFLRRRFTTDARFEHHWNIISRPPYPLGLIDPFPPFPNPHIRSNAFALRRDRLRLLPDIQVESKDDACMFESGPAGATASFRGKGLSTLVVGRDGAAFDVERWPQSGTFRLADQANLLVHDNQTRAFAEMSSESRVTHARMTWGDFLGPPPAGFPTLGIEFPARMRAPVPTGSQ